MEDLMYFIIALLLAACYNNIMRPSSAVQAEMNHISIMEHTKEAESKTAAIIKERLTQIYHSDIDDKREKITRLLVQLEKVEDPDVFFDNNDHIRSYIFNMNY